ncbi:MAG: DUF4149 domain-containing protein [Burkholderiales bacterium]|nr:DUF4149 domain-containing protein [Burkholderiales bacterium]
MPARIALFAAALWWGSLSVIGFVVVPMLFAHLPTPAVAGQMAARLFSMQSWVSLLCGLSLLMLLKRGGAERTGATLFVVMVGLLLALLLEYAVAPRILTRENLRLWHGAGTAIYSLQWLCATVVLWRQAGATRAQS